MVWEISVILTDLFIKTWGLPSFPCACCDLQEQFDSLTLFLFLDTFSQSEKYKLALHFLQDLHIPSHTKLLYWYSLSHLRVFTERYAGSAGA